MPQGEWPARIASRAPPGYCATAGGRTHGFVGRHPGGTVPGSSLKGSGGASEPSSMARFLKTLEFRKHPETFEINHTQVPHSSRYSQGPLEHRATGREPQGSVGHGIPGGLSRGVASDPPFEGTFSNKNKSVMSDLF